MLKLPKWLLAISVTLTLLLSGCSEPTLDTSSKQALSDSGKEIMATLSEEDQERFKETIAGIYMLGAFASLGNDGNMDEIKARIDEKLHGKTAEEIFQIADEIEQQMDK